MVGSERGHEHHDVTQLGAAISPSAGVDYAVLSEQGRKGLRVQGCALAQVVGAAH
jgi:hypothetical protein